MTGSLSLPQINVLCNMTEVVVRRIEQAWAVNIAKHDAQQRLSRALSAYETPLLFVDAGDEGRDPPEAWNIMYLNDAACGALGARRVPPEEPMGRHCLSQLRLLWRPAGGRCVSAQLP